MNNEVVKELIKDNPLKMTVTSDSMEPFLNIGDKITVKYTPFNLIKKYNIIVFIKNGKLICHYVKQINPLTLNGKKLIITQGSKSPSEDYPITEDDILGIVTSQKLSLSFITKENVKLIKNKILNQLGFVK